MEMRKENKSWRYEIDFNSIFIKSIATSYDRVKSPIFPFYIWKIRIKDFLKTDYVTSIPNALQKLFLDEFQEEKKKSSVAKQLRI